MIIKYFLSLVDTLGSIRTFKEADFRYFYLSVERESYVMLSSSWLVFARWIW